MDGVLPLFTAEGERSWVEGWAPEYLHLAEAESDPGGQDATAAPGTVFRTNHGGEETLWLVLEYDAPAGVARYARFTPGSRLGTVSVRCEDAGASGTTTRVTVTYELTALSPAGEAVLRAMTADTYRAMLSSWEETLSCSSPPQRSTG